MKTIIILLMIFGLYACDESTVTQPKEENISDFNMDLLTKQVWSLYEVEPSVGYWVPKFKFNKDKTFQSYINEYWESGTWEIEVLKTLPVSYNIRLTFVDNTIFTSEVKLFVKSLELSQLSLELVENNSSIVARYIRDNTVSGSAFFTANIINPNNKSIPEGAKAYLVWSVFNNANNINKEYFYIWGEGNLNKEKTKFDLMLNWHIPDDALNIFSNNSDRVGIAYIVLSKTNLEIGKIKDMDKYNSMIIGTVSDRAIIYKNGFFNESKTKLGWWANSFVNGFSIAKGEYNNQKGNQGFLLNNSNELDLLISTDEKDFKFPDWH